MKYILNFNIIGIFFLLFLFGCYQKNSDIPTAKNNDKTELLLEELQFDLGIIEDDHVFECLLSGDDVKVVKKIIRSCGCVGPSVQEGDKLVFNEPFQINISVTNRTMGVGTQEFYIYFTDETFVRIEVQYNYFPLPTFTPASIIFKSDETEKIVTFVFPKENNVTIKNIQIPSYFSWNETTYSFCNLD
jgi:hypothetical protein